MKNIITDKGLLTGAVAGAGLGFALAWLSGAPRIGTTIVFGILGGVVGYSGEDKSFSGADGRRRWFAPQPPPQGGGI